MTRNKLFLLFVLFIFAVGCASGGMKKPTVFADKYNSIPADIPSQFLHRYYFLINKEAKEFKKLLTDEERQEFIDKFWLERDPDPTTPENEEKQKIDERIDNISNEFFFNGLSTAGLTFRSNDGFRGDLAKVYLLHGEPDVMDSLEGRSFVPLMLWAYLNPENGSIRYAFLFYQKGGFASFRLFPQDSYQMDFCGAIYEVATTRTYNYTGGLSQSCPEELYQIYNDIYQSSGKNGNLDGMAFAWALLNFSNDSETKQGTALQPPKPASKIATESTARITGEAPERTGKAGVDYILASCEKCNSMIPASLSLGAELRITALLKDLDWAVTGENLDSALKYRIVFQSNDGGEPIVVEGVMNISLKKKVLDEHPGDILPISLLDQAELSAIPAGTYQVNVYVQSTLTKRYNTWVKELTK